MRKADTKWEQEGRGEGQWFAVLGNHCPRCPGGCLACSRWAHLLFSSRPCKPLLRLRRICRGSCVEASGPSLHLQSENQGPKHGWGTIGICIPTVNYFPLAPDVLFSESDLPQIIVSQSEDFSTIQMFQSGCFLGGRKPSYLLFPLPSCLLCHLLHLIIHLGITHLWVVTESV